MRQGEPEVPLTVQSVSSVMGRNHPLLDRDCLEEVAAGGPLVPTEDQEQFVTTLATGQQVELWKGLSQQEPRNCCGPQPHLRVSMNKRPQLLFSCNFNAS